MRADLMARDRRLQQLERQLGLFDVSRRLAGVRAKLVSAEGRLSVTMTRRHNRAVAQLGIPPDASKPQPTGGPRTQCAVCWTEDPPRPALSGHAADVRPDSIRITFHKGSWTASAAESKNPRSAMETSIKDFEAAIASWNRSSKLEDGDLALDSKLAPMTPVQLLSRSVTPVSKGPTHVGDPPRRGELSGAVTPRHDETSRD